ncbi:MAG: DUF559 domain-containing protein [Enterobacterales bacterium]|nr:DUF559 domain-containing protein [Enterobacterales bacterium]
MQKNQLKHRSKELRKNQTKQEELLWYHFRGRRFKGFKFRRQFIIQIYIVDFVCLNKRLIVEIDGSQHQENKGYDTKRDKILKDQGFKILRYWNNEIDFKLVDVLEDILRALEK